MLEKIINTLIHPSRVVVYFADNMKKTFFFVFCFYLILVGFLALVAFNSTYYSITSANRIAYLLTTNDIKDVTLSDSKLTGEAFSIKKDDVYIGFLEDTHKSTDLSINFYENNVSIYYLEYHIGSYSYNDYDIKFNTTNIKNNILEDKINFRDFIYELISNLNTFLRIENFTTYVVKITAISFLIYSFVILYSYFINKTIDLNVRYNLGFFTLPIFYVVMFFSLSFNLSILEYLAYLLPFIYARMIYTRIYKIKK